MAIVDLRTLQAAFALLALVVICTPGPGRLRPKTPASSSTTALRLQNCVRMNALSDFANEFLAPDRSCRWPFVVSSTADSSRRR